MYSWDLLSKGWHTDTGLVMHAKRGLDIVASKQHGYKRWAGVVIAVVVVSAVAVAVSLWRNWQSQQQMWQVMQSAQAEVAVGLPPSGERQKQGPLLLPLCITSPQGCPFDRRVYQVPFDSHLQSQTADAALRKVLSPVATTDVTCQTNPQGVTCVTVYKPAPDRPAVQVAANAEPKPFLDGVNAVWVTEIATFPPAAGSSR